MGKYIETKDIFKQLKVNQLILYSDQGIKKQ